MTLNNAKGNGILIIIIDIYMALFIMHTLFLLLNGTEHVALMIVKVSSTL